MNRIQSVKQVDAKKTRRPFFSYYVMSLLVLASCARAAVLGLEPSQQSVREGVERGNDGDHINLDEPYR